MLCSHRQHRAPRFKIEFVPFHLKAGSHSTLSCHPYMRSNQLRPQRCRHPPFHFLQRNSQTETLYLNGVDSFGMSKGEAFGKIPIPYFIHNPKPISVIAEILPSCATCCQSMRMNLGGSLILAPFWTPLPGLLLTKRHRYTR